MTQQEALREPLKPIGVGMPHWLLLNEFARMVHESFPGGGFPYLVGSALASREPRDIDVRLILPDEDFHRLFRMYGLNQPLTGWAHTCLVWSHYGTHHVGKPVDFQIQSQTHVTGLYAGQPRLPLGTPPFGAFPHEREITAPAVEKAMQERRGQP